MVGEGEEEGGQPQRVRSVVVRHLANSGEGHHAVTTCEVDVEIELNRGVVLSTSIHEPRMARGDRHLTSRQGHHHEDYRHLDHMTLRHRELGENNEEGGREEKSVFYEGYIL